MMRKMGLAGLALLAAAAARAEDATARAALEDLGYVIDADAGRSYDDAERRFLRLAGKEPELLSLREKRSLLQRARLDGLPCPDWSKKGASESASNGGTTEFIVRFRGPNIARQIAAAHQRIAECHRDFLYAANGAGRLLFFEKATSKQVRSAGDLGADYAALAPFLAATESGEAKPTYDIAINPASSFQIEFTPTHAGKPTPPDAEELAQACRELGMAEGCVTPESLKPVKGPWSSETRKYDFAGYEGAIRTRQGVIVLEAPENLVDRLGFDLSEASALQTGADGVRRELRPHYYRSGVRQNEEAKQWNSGDFKPAEKCGAALDAPGDFGARAQDLTNRFWGQLLHDPGDWKVTIDEKSVPGWLALIQGKLAPEEQYLIGAQDILIVDNFGAEPGDPSSRSPEDLGIGDESEGAESGFREPRRDEDNSGEEEDNSGEETESGAIDARTLHANMNGTSVRSFDPARLVSSDEKISHTAFAANVIGATSFLGRGGNAKMMTGLAPGASISAVPVAPFREAMARRSYDFVSVIYDPAMEPCAPNADGTGVGTQGDAGHANVDKITNDLTEAIEDPRREATVYVVSAPQAPQAKSCFYLDNYTLENVQRKKANPASTGLRAPNAPLNLIPAYYYPNRVTIPYPSVCRGFHCDMEYPFAILAGALDKDGKPRINTRLSFRQKVLFAPGTDILAGDGDGDGFGVRCGTSFAGPLVTAIAAQVRAYHDMDKRNIKRWLAATASIWGSQDATKKKPELADLVDADMSYGAVNLQRALQSDPKNFTIWEDGRAKPSVATSIVIREGSAPANSPEVPLKTVKCRNEREGKEEWARPLSLIKRRQTAIAGDLGKTFHFIHLPGDIETSDSKSLRSEFNFKAAVGTVACADSEGCIRAKLRDGGERVIPLSTISHIVFPVKYWNWEGERSDVCPAQ